jgi:hypothetical protein
MDKPKKQKKMIEFSLNASGWMNIFQLGVMSFLQEIANLDNATFVGTSAGAAVACAVCCKMDLVAVSEEVVQQVKHSKKDFILMVPLMMNCFERMIPMNVAESCDKRLGIVCTEVDRCNIKTVEFSTYKNRQELIDLIHATCHVPILGGYLPRVYRNRWLYDGLFTETHPRSTDHDVFKISWTPTCDCGCCKEKKTRLFCPSVHFPLRWCFLPPSERTMRLIYYHGYCRARASFLKEGFPLHLFNIDKSRLLHDGETVDLNFRKIDKVSPSLAFAELIEEELKQEVEASNSRWSHGKYLCVAIRLLFPYLPIAWLVQPFLADS